MCCFISLSTFCVIVSHFLSIRMVSKAPNRYVHSNVIHKLKSNTSQLIIDRSLDRQEIHHTVDIGYQPYKEGNSCTYYDMHE